ncbi:hypothetical protein AX17_001413 [Amanita inopinata Kibby_2008]|nr:hypothetical protein AX17_001413 [Amanita inopinata Kibby_2008]
MNVPSFQLNNGTKIPAVGLGCWIGSVGNDQRVYDMCAKGLKIGYRHVDTAAQYGNERMVGKAVRDSGIPRSSIYITTKLGLRAGHRVREAFEESLKELDCEYIDLYLIHWPQVGSYKENGDLMALNEEHPGFINVWKEVEKLVETGKVKSIGVSNFSVKTLSTLLPHCKIIPAVNQVEMHPCLPQQELKAFCDERGILLTAYSPLGQTATSVFTESPIICAIADKLKITPAQVVFTWAVQRGIIIIPKSENEERLLANITLVKLQEEDMKTMNEFHSQPGMHKSLLAYHAPNGTVIGWTYKELGWKMTTGGPAL